MTESSQTPAPPSLSVIVRTKDRPGLLAEALESLRAQTYRDFEVVLVNDSDEPLPGALLEGPPGRGPRVVSPGPPHGRSRALNAGAAAATGRWLAYLDDDDLYLPDHLATMSALLSGPDAPRAAYSDCDVVRQTAGPDGVWQTVSRSPAFGRDFEAGRLPFANFIPLICLVHERTLWEELGGFDESFDLYEDWDFLVRLARLATPRHVARTTALYRLRDDDSNATLATPWGGAVSREARLAIYRKHWDLHTPEAEMALFDACERETQAALERERGAFEALAETSRRLEEARSEAERAGLLLEERTRRLADLHRELEGSRRALALVNESLAERRRELEAERTELHEVRRLLTVIETSRFWKARNRWWNLKEKLSPTLGLGPSAPDPMRVLAPRPRKPGPAAGPAAGRVPPGEPAAPSTSEAEASIIVCIHNALEDVRACLDSVLRHTRPPYRLILVDDGSSPDTRDFVEGFARAQGAEHIRNETARGYTRAANQGLSAATSPYAVLLNSDTIVTPHWLERLIGCAESDPAIGLVGPLSSCASWQSVPDVFDANGDWSENPLPDGVTPERMASLLACAAGPVYPRLPFLNGFCLLLTQDVRHEVGLFDEEAFGKGYGEENDYALRAARAGFSLAVADDAYVLHRQSRSYSHERRKALAEAAGEALARKHGPAVIEEGVRVCRGGRVMEALRERSRRLVTRAARLEEDRARFEGKRVLFVLPVTERGGGANVVLAEARAMARLGVDARILNLSGFMPFFERAYPHPGVPVLEASAEGIPAVARRFDAVVATAYTSVEWIAPLDGAGPVLGYYVQDFEPAFFEPGSSEYKRALASYTRVPGLVLVTKTEWNREEVARATGAGCAVVGPSFEADLFRPFRERPAQSPVRVAAMLRPSTPRSAPRRTVDVLRRLSERFGDRVAITVFGFDAAGPDGASLQGLPAAFVRSGILEGPALASLFNDVHVFADLSDFQAMGLTALEALGCGATAVVPSRGGAASFARHEENALAVDTSSEEACLEALSRLVEDAALRARLMERGHRDVVEHHPLEAARRMLEALFPSC